MIAINLIPAELRSTGATPLPRRLIIYGGVALNCIAFVVGMTYFLATIPGMEAEKTSVDSEVYQAQVVRKVGEEYDGLVQQKRDFEERKGTIDKIGRTRIIWAKKLDQLWDMVPPEMWLTSLELVEGKTTSKGVEPDKLVICGYTAGSEVARVSDFIKSLERRVADKENFYDIFDHIKLAELRLDEENFQEYEEGVATYFAIELTLKPLEEEDAGGGTPAKK